MYRKVADTSEVDETLFGSTRRPGANGAGGEAAVTAKKGSKVARLKAPKVTANSATLTSSTLDAIRARSKIRTAEDEARDRRAALAEREALNKQAMERKKMMLLKEEEGKAAKRLTETELLKQTTDAETRDRAQWMLNENLDQVKKMNQMMLYAKCVTIRDNQIEEKQCLRGDEADETRRLDLMMEIERLKTLEIYEQREAKRVEDRKKGAAMLQRQIEERERARHLEEDKRELERKAVLAEIERMRVEEERQMEEKREQGRRLLAEVQKSNFAQIERKKAILEEEKEEDERIALYIKMKEAKEAEEAERQAHIAKEKELELARMRAKQEKMTDKQAELDELRAQRAHEAYERDWRRRERESAERVANMNADLARAREDQRAMKMAQLAEIAEQERADYYRVISAQRAEEAAEKSAAETAASLRRQQRDEVLMQIKANEEKKLKERQDFLREGELLREKYAEEIEVLEGIKERKLKELEAQGVPVKYRAELARKRVV